MIIVNNFDEIIVLALGCAVKYGFFGFFIISVIYHSPVAWESRKGLSEYSGYNIEINVGINIVYRPARNIKTVCFIKHCYKCSYKLIERLIFRKLNVIHISLDRVAVKIKLAAKCF